MCLQPMHQTEDRLTTHWQLVLQVSQRKGKERLILYSAFILRIISKRSGMDHTVLPAN